MPFLDPEELKPKLREVFETVVIPQIKKAKMKQTAVETLIEIYYGNEGQLTIKDLEKAKEMEKKQIIEFAEEYSSKCSSVHNGIVFNSEPADQYYNKKYSQE